MSEPPRRRPPLFSIVIPTYNRSASVRTAIRSALAQTETDFELFIVDDGSTDDTAARLGRFQGDARVHVLVNQKNRGQHACRNQAIREAQGEWICFLDSDDLFLPLRLERLREAIEKRPETGFWFTNAYLHRYGRIIGLLFDPKRDIPEGVVPGHYAVGDAFLPYVTTMVAVRRGAFLKTGFFREDLKILEDTELYARMLKDGLPVGVLREPLAVRFIHESQITRDHERDFSESMVALKSSGARPDVQAKARERIALEVAGYLWKALKPAQSRELLILIQGRRAKGTWAYWRTFLPIAPLGWAKSLRTWFLRTRYHPAFVPEAWRQAGRAVDDLAAATSSE